MEKGGQVGGTGRAYTKLLFLYRTLLQGPGSRCLEAQALHLRASWQPAGRLAREAFGKQVSEAA